MTYKAEKNWSGNYTYRGYTINKSEGNSYWDYYGPNTPNYKLRDGYGNTLKDAISKIDRELSK